MITMHYTQIIIQIVVRTQHIILNVHRSILFAFPEPSFAICNPASFYTCMQIQPCLLPDVLLKVNKQQPIYPQSQHIKLSQLVSIKNNSIYSNASFSQKPIPEFPNNKNKQLSQHGSTNKYQSNFNPKNLKEDTFNKSRISNNPNKQSYHKQIGSHSKIKTQEQDKYKRSSFYDMINKNILRQSSQRSQRSQSKSSFHIPNTLSKYHQVQHHKTISKNHRPSHKIQSLLDSSYQNLEDDQKSMYLEQFKCKIEDEVKNINKVLERLKQKSQGQKSSRRQQVIKVDISPSKLSQTRMIKTPRSIQSRSKGSQYNLFKLNPNPNPKNKSSQKSIYNSNKRDLLAKSQQKKFSNPLSNPKIVNKRELLTTRIAKYY